MSTPKLSDREKILSVFDLCEVEYREMGKSVRTKDRRFVFSEDTGEIELITDYAVKPNKTVRAQK